LSMWGLPKLKRAAFAVRPLAPDTSRSEVSGGLRVADASEDGLMGLVGMLPEALLHQAITHSSWVDRRTDSYERLEFLGDSVLGLAMASALYEKYPDREEGELARVKAFVVSRASCAQVALRLGVDSLVVDQGTASLQKRREAAESPTILGNILEALIGACFLSYGFARTARAVVEAFSGQMAFAVTEHVDFKTTLQELVALRGQHPAYHLIAEEGPAHARRFTSEVLLDGTSYGIGSGTTIKMSEQQAAREALSSLAPPPEG
jgi:ribonuclease III